MKRKITVIALAAMLILTSCSQEVEDPSSTLYANREDLLYAENGEIQTIATTADVTETEISEVTTTTPLETKEDETTTVSDSASPVVTTTKPTGNFVFKEEEEENVYNTTVNEYLEDIVIKPLEITYYNRYVEKPIDYSYLGDDVDTSDLPQTEIHYFGINRNLNLNEDLYGTLVHNFFDIDNVLLSRGRLGVYYDIRKDDKNPYEFKFYSVEHQLQKEYQKVIEGQTQKGMSDDALFSIELEDCSGKILTGNRFIRLDSANAILYKFKGIAVRLRPFTEVDSNGNAVIETKCPTRFIVEVPKEKKEYQLKVGMPISRVIEMIGEGKIIEGTNIIDEKENITEEVKLHVYKTDDYTLVIEEKAFPEVIPSEYFTDVEKDTVLVSTIVLVRNEVEEFDYEAYYSGELTPVVDEDGKLHYVRTEDLEKEKENDATT